MTGKILIIDDDKDFINSLKNSFEHHGFHVTETMNLEQAMVFWVKKPLISW